MLIGHFVTIMYGAGIVNKQYNYTDGVISKADDQTQFFDGIAVCKYVPSLIELYMIILEISKNPNAVLVLGYHPGAVVDQEYHVFRHEKFIKPGLENGTIIQKGSWFEYADGSLKFAARTKDSMALSVYSCFDHDIGMTFDLWCNAMNNVLPGFTDAQGFKVGSNSARMGMIGADKKWHYYFKAENVDDLINFGQRMLTQTEVPLVDVSVLGQSNRVFYEGMPIFLSGTPTPPVNIEVFFDRPNVTIDTSQVKFVEGRYTFSHKYQEIRQPDGTTKRKRVSSNTTVVKGVLKLDTAISIKHADDTVTPRQLIGDASLYDKYGDNTGKIRCQATFDERGSTSWNGILRQGDDKAPLLIDNGSGIKYKLDTGDLGAVAGFGNLPAPAQVQAPEQAQAQAQALIERYREGVGIHLPMNTLSDTEHAQSFLNIYYNSGIHLIEREGSYFRWNGKYWEGVTEGFLEAHFSHTMGVDATAAKVGSGFKQLQRICRLQGHQVKDAPPHQITCNNGVFDVEQGWMIPFDHNYFHVHCNDFDYDPDATCPTLDKIIAAQEQDASWTRQLDQMMGYCLAGGINKDHKAMVLDGATRSGKTLIARALTKMLGGINVEAHNLSDITESKIIANLYTTKLFYDDDCQTPAYQDMKNVASNFKKFISGTQHNNKQMYTQEVKRGTIHVKMLLLSNGVPEIYDHSGATSSRLLVLPFNLGFVGREDITLENNLMKELPGLLNRWHRGYKDYLAHGFTICEESRHIMEEDREAVQPLMSFFNDNARCVINPEGKVKITQLATEIEVWAIATGNPIAKFSTSKMKKIIKQTLGGVPGVQFKRCIWFKDETVVSGFLGLSLAGDTPKTNVLPFK